MFKHYYVSPKKRSKSQSSDNSEPTEPASNQVHQDCLSEFVKNISQKTFSNFNEITSSNPNVSIATSPSHSIQHGGGGGDEHDKLHTSETTTPTQTQQKSYETRLSRMRLAHAFSNAVSYSRTRLAHLPAGASFCVGHVYGSVLNTGNAECQTNNHTSGLTPPVRRWNSFHSTRGECHPNKFRRDRKSTSPSIV